MGSRDKVPTFFACLRFFNHFRIYLAYLVFLWPFLIFTIFLPILDPFWPFVIFGVNFLYSVICAYINCVIMQKIALINGISMGIFNFYHFLTYFWTLFDLFLAF